MSQDSLVILDSVLDALAHLIGGEDHRRMVVAEKGAIEAFDGFELFDPRMPGADDTELNVAASAEDVPIWPMDAKWAMPWAHEGGGWIFKRVRTLRPADWRGRLRVVFPRMFEHQEAVVHPTGHKLGSIGALAVVRGQLIEAAIPRSPSGVSTADIYGFGRNRPQADASTLFDVTLAQGIELRREYHWSVMLGEIGLPRCRFVTDPLGCREAFRLRDLPPGRNRRAALRNWVSEHWRQRRNPMAEDRAWVRAHLRGAEDFTWNGLRCRIEPSREDLRKQSRLKEPA